MNYEEKYKQALERASKLRVQNPFDTVGQKVEHIFPELKENENEKIRKDILCYFEHYVHDINGIDVQKWINWLEKQGEQKPADKVKPEFHEGDWVVNKFGDSWHIDSFDKENYQVSNGKGNYNWFSISKQDEMHLWTIQDAKDGDVLAYKNGDAEWVLIYKSVIPETCNVSQDILKYHALLTDIDFYDSSIAVMISENYASCFTPATKEQCDLFFAKMKEAGWERIVKIKN